MSPELMIALGLPAVDLRPKEEARREEREAPAKRPLRFSVCVPCHTVNPAWLQRTLRSVTAQLDWRQHQLFVVDDSPDGLPGAVAIEEGWGVLSKSDEGGTAAHNAGIRFADGDLVHALHPDDWVLPGFYASVADAYARTPKASLIATQSVWVGEDGAPLRVPRVEWCDARGRFQPLHNGNPLCVAACVVPKWAYERFGGWDERLPHCSDWECWARLTAKGEAVALIDWPLACYRLHGASHTSRLARTAGNFRDYLAMADIARAYMPLDRAAFAGYVRGRVGLQVRDMEGDAEAAAANLAFLDEIREWEGS